MLLTVHHVVFIAILTTQKNEMSEWWERNSLQADLAWTMQNGKQICHSSFEALPLTTFSMLKYQLQSPLLTWDFDTPLTMAMVFGQPGP